MENLDKRVQATMFIWGALGVALGLSGLGDVSNFNDTIIAIVAAAAAFLSTGVVWYAGREQTTTTEKSKHGGEDTKTRLLLELLDEDERRILKNRLMDDLSADGESVSLTDLLQSERANNHHR